MHLLLLWKDIGDIEKTMKIPLRRGSEEAGLYAREAAWRLLRHMYAALPPADIKDTVLAAVGGNAVRLVSACMHARLPGAGGSRAALL